MTTTTEPRILGSIEVAEVLKVRQQTVHAWKHRGQLPDPDYESINGQPAWRYETIVHWAGTTGRLNKAKHRKLTADFRTLFGTDPTPHHPQGRRKPDDPALNYVKPKH